MVMYLQKVTGKVLIEHLAHTFTAVVFKELASLPYAGSVKACHNSKK
jgi:hypothetical protein